MRFFMIFVAKQLTKQIAWAPNYLFIRCLTTFFKQFLTISGATIQHRDAKGCQKEGLGMSQGSPGGPTEAPGGHWGVRLGPLRVSSPPYELQRETPNSKKA